MSQYRRYPKHVELPKLDQMEWLDAIEKMYGVRLGYQEFGSQVYADKRRYVYAASEYVCKLAADSTSPEDATEWSDSLCHRPIKGGMETANLLSTPFDN